MLSIVDERSRPKIKFYVCWLRRGSHKKCKGSVGGYDVPLWSAMADCVAGS